MPNAESGIVYVDSSALVKLVIEEPESAALAAHLAETNPLLATSRVALVEVARATEIASPGDVTRAETRRLLDSCLLVDLTSVLLQAAAELASREVRTLDAIHLASARRVDPDEMLVYDGRLRAAASELGLSVAHPGT